MKSSSKASFDKINHEKLGSSRQVNDIETNKIIESVADLLSNDSDLVVNTAIEKQILAFSYREVSKNSSGYIKEESLIEELQFAGTLNPKQWWRRFALPSVVAGGFVLTVLAFQVLWEPLLNNQVPQPVSTNDAQLAQQQKVKQTQVELIVNNSEPEYLISTPSAVSLAIKKDRQQALADFDENIKMPNPDLRITDQENTKLSNRNRLFVSKGFIDTSLSIKDDLGAMETEPKQTGTAHLYTGSQLFKSEHPEQEIWVKRIIKLFKESKNDKAIKELELFRVAYPEYPVDDKIEQYNQ